VRASDLDPLNNAYSSPPLTTLLGLRRYPEAIERTTLYSKRFPNDPDWHIVHARIESYTQNSAEPLRAALQDHGSQLDPGYRNVIEAEVARAEGRYLDAVRLWAAVPPEEPLARGERIGFLYLAAGDTRHAEQSFQGAEDFALALQKREPGRVVPVELAMVQSMLGKHAAALATIENARARAPESRDATNGPYVSFMRSVILVRAGRSAEGYAEVARLLHVPYGSPVDFYDDFEPVRLLLSGDPRYDELLIHPPRL